MSQGLKITFLVHFIVGVLFGVVLYLIPGIWAALVNWAPLDPAAIRMLGAAMLAIAISSWFGYRATRWEEVRIIIQMEIALTVLSALGGAYQALFAGAPSFIWVAMVIYVGFAVAWIYFYLRRPA